MSHVGLIGACLADPSTSLEQSFGPVRMHAGTQSARGTPKSTTLGNLAAIARVMRSLLGARLDGSYKRTPFFDIDTGRPVVTPKVLDAEERSQLMQAV